MLFQITVTDKNGVVIDTGWVDFPPGNREGSDLYDSVLEYGLNEGIHATPVDAERA